ncbi:MAG: hypothetical protein V1740_01465 [Candidatus Woesearchaeota archaeon]
MIIILPVAFAFSIYPEPYFKDEFNSVIFIGENADYYDGVSANNLEKGLGIESETKDSIATYKIGDLHVFGDAYQIRQTGDILEGSEDIDDVIDYLDRSNLNLLRDGVFSTNKGDYDYDQKLKMPEMGYSTFEYADGVPDDDKNIPQTYMKFEKYPFYVYTLEFLDTPSSNIDSNFELEDFEKGSITILGKEFYLIDTDHPANNSIKFTLLSGAIKDILQEGEKKEYELGGKKYEVEVFAIKDIDPKSVKFKINGNPSTSMLEGGSDVVDGIRISVSEIIPNEAGDVTLDLVEFYLDSYKLELKDTDITSDNNGGEEFKINDNTIDDTKVEIFAEDDGITENGDFKLKRITINWTPTDDHFMLGEQFMSEVVEEKDVLFGNLDYYFYGSNPDNEVEMIELKPKGSDEYVLSFENLNGELLEIPLFYYGGSSFSRFGNANHRLVVDEVMGITQNDFFLVTTDGYANPTDAKGLTKLFQYKGQDVSENTLKFKDMGTGEIFKINYNATDSLNVGGEEFLISVSQSASNNGNISIDLNKDGSIDSGDVPVLVTKYQGKIKLDATNHEMFEFISIAAEEGPFLSVWGAYGVTEGHDYIHVTVGADSSGNIDVDSIGDCLSSNLDELEAALGAGLAKAVQDSCYETLTNTTYKMMYKVGDSDFYEGSTSVGQFVEWKKNKDGPDDVYIASAKKRDETLFFVTDKDARFELIEGREESILGYVSENIKIDSDTSDSENIISIGGPCVNKKTAEILGLEYPTCGDLGISSGQALIKEFDYNEGKALVIFGYSAEDTFNAVVKLNEGIEIFDNGVLVEDGKIEEFKSMIEKKKEAVTTTTVPKFSLSCPGGPNAKSSYVTDTRKLGFSVKTTTYVSVDMDGTKGKLDISDEAPFEAAYGVDWLDFTVHIKQDNCNGPEVQTFSAHQADGDQTFIFDLDLPKEACYCVLLENKDLIIDSAKIGVIPNGKFEMMFRTG